MDRWDAGGLKSRLKAPAVASPSAGTSVHRQPTQADASHIPSFPPLLLLLPFLTAILPAVALAARGRFDGLYGQDPFAYYDYAVGPLRQSLGQLRPPPPFYWPPGYPLLVTLSSLSIGARPLAGQLVSLIGSGLVAVFTTLLAREVWLALPRRDERSRLAGPVAMPAIAGLAMALCGQLWQSS